MIISSVCNCKVGLFAQSVRLSSTFYTNQDAPEPLQITKLRNWYFDSTVNAQKSHQFDKSGAFQQSTDCQRDQKPLSSPSLSSYFFMVLQVFLTISLRLHSGEQAASNITKHITVCFEWSREAGQISGYWPSFWRFWWSPCTDCL